LIVLITVALLAGCTPTSPAPATAPTQSPTQAPTAQPAAVSFARDVLPIFDQQCVKCHGGDKPADGLSLESYTDLMKKPVIQPGSANASELVKLIVSGAMPRRAPRLSDAQIKTISDWVNAGVLNN
jgi:mono/diheme cytochrome c family protein